MLTFLGVNNWSSSFPIVEKKTLKVSAFLESSKTYSFCSFIVGPIRVDFADLPVKRFTTFQNRLLPLLVPFNLDDQ